MQAGNNEATLEWPRSLRSISYKFFQPWEAGYRPSFEHQISTDADKASERTGQLTSRARERSETTKLIIELNVLIFQIATGGVLFMLLLLPGLGMELFIKHLSSLHINPILLSLMKFISNALIIIDSLLFITFIINVFSGFILGNIKD
jgi:hypothetical protein